MNKSVTFRMAEEKLEVLDGLAATMDRDRSYVLNEAVTHYLDVKQWQIEETRKAIAEADDDDFASADEVRAAFDSFKRQP